MTSAAAWLLALSVPGIAGATFSGTASMNGDTCDTSQFNASEIEPGRAASQPTITAVSSATDPAHVIQGKCSIQYYMPAYGKRAENRYGGGGSSRNVAPGMEVWIARWQFLDPAHWAQQGFNVGHHLTMQMKTTDTTSGGPFAFDDRGTGGGAGNCPTTPCWQYQPYEFASGVTILSQPVVTGEWDAWLYHFKMSQDPAVGLIEIWKNGALQYSQHHQTIDNAGNSDYYKQGIYQSTNVSADSRLWIDGTTMSTTESAAELGAWGVASKGP